MSQDSFVYSFVAKGIVILAEYTEFTGNFSAIANQCLQKLPFINNKYTYNCDHCTYHFLLEDGYVYCVVAKEALSKQISTAFLERVREDFKTRYGGGKAETDVAKSLNKDFGPIMKDHMRYIIEHAEEIEELIKVKAQASEVKSKMSEDIEKILSKHMCCRYTLSSEMGQVKIMTELNRSQFHIRHVLRDLNNIHNIGRPKISGYKELDSEGRCGTRT